jgi:zinc transporter ZupT
MLLEILLGVVLSAVHIFGEDIVNSYKKHDRHKILSFAAGISITYLFLQFLPELYIGVEVVNKVIFVYVLLGFILLHLREKYIYQHLESERLLYELKEAHSIAFFVYHFLLGIVVVQVIKINLVQGLLFYIPILLHAGVSNVALSELHYHIKEKFNVRLLLSLAPFSGVLVGLLVNISSFVHYMLLGFVAGALIYVIIRDILPEDRSGYVEYFIIGSILYALIIIATWMI